jgi:hypothetical protein
MKSLIIAGAVLAASISFAHADSTKLGTSFNGGTNAGGSNSFDGGGAANNGHQYSQSGSGQVGYATTGVNGADSTSYISTAGSGSGRTYGTGQGGFDYAGQGSANAWSNFSTNYTSGFKSGW